MPSDVAPIDQPRAADSLRLRAEKATWTGDLSTAWRCYEALTGVFFTPGRSLAMEPDRSALSDFAWTALACGRLPHAYQLAWRARHAASRLCDEEDSEVQLAAIASRLGDGARADEHMMNAELARDTRIIGPDAVRTMLWEHEAVRGRAPAHRLPLPADTFSSPEDAARIALLRSLRVVAEDTELARTEVVLARAWAEESGHCETRIGARLAASAVALACGEYELARSEAESARSLAERNGYELHAIDALVARARAELALGGALHALDTTAIAIGRAADPFCAYAWGHGNAAHLAGLAHLMERQWGSAQRVLEIAAEIRRRAHDPELEDTTLLLHLVRHARGVPVTPSGAVGSE